jgi:D-alanyl-D-alanine carboxypeptidase
MKKSPLKNDNLFALSLLSFVFIASTSLAMSKWQGVKKIRNEVTNKNFSAIPELKEDSASFPVISAQSVLAVDIDSGTTLYEKNPDLLLLPASTTKIVTALVAMDYYNNDAILTVNGVSVDGQKMGLVTGEKIKVQDLLNGLLIYSANDAAEVLAANYPGGRDAFIAAMNLKAKELNLLNTNFTNPSGLETANHFSTARDLVRVAKYAMQNPSFAQVVATKESVVKSTDGKISHRLANINELIGKVDGVLGVKTGWTENARENLVTYIKRDDKRIMIALLGSQDRFGETEELIGWIFDNYEWEGVSLSKKIELYSP